MAEYQAISAGKLRGFRSAALELIDHLAFGNADIAYINGEAQFGRRDFNADMANADFSHEGVRIAIAALRGITECEQKPFITARQILQPHRA